MNYLILEENDIVFYISKTVKKLPHGNTLVDGPLEIPNVLIKDIVEYEENIPDDFVENKYCYTEKKGFYPNPDWVEPVSEYQQGYDRAVLDILEVENQ